MVTPDRHRAAVVRLVVRFGVSQRRACGVVGQHRWTQRLIHPGFCAGSKDWSEYGIYGYTSEGGEVSPLL